MEVVVACVDDPAAPQAHAVAKCWAERPRHHPFVPLHPDHHRDVQPEFLERHLRRGHVYGVTSPGDQVEVGGVWRDVEFEVVPERVQERQVGRGDVRLLDDRAAQAGDRATVIGSGSCTGTHPHRGPAGVMNVSPPTRYRVQALR